MAEAWQRNLVTITVNLEIYNILFNTKYTIQIYKQRIRKTRLESKGGKGVIIEAKT